MFITLCQHLVIDRIESLAFELQRKACLARSRAPRLNRSPPGFGDSLDQYLVAGGIKYS
jgi:hypothetical protein